MPDDSEVINTHYGQQNLSAKILTAFQEIGKDINALTREDLTSFDEHHGGGRESTRELAGLAGLGEGMHVLDIGSGIGGPARTLAAEFGCQVTGLDLTEEFCHAAAMLTERVGLKDQIPFKHGSALDMPFDDATFDVVWTQDVFMNIEDKGRLFAEVHRVLRPGGCLAFQANMTGRVPELYFPVFWADEARHSYLISSEECHRLLNASGFQERVWRDTTAQMVEQSRRRLATGSEAAPSQDGPLVLGLGLIVATNLEERSANMLRNFAEGRLEKVTAIFERPVLR